MTEYSQKIRVNRVQEPKVRVRVKPRVPPLEIELQNTGTVVQWRLGTTGTWIDLIEIDDINASVAVGTVTTLPAGASATVENVGTAQDVILNFGIPEGGVSSVNGETGVVVIDAGDIGFTPTGAIAATTVAGAIAELDTEKQPIDADLTAIAALTTTSFGRSLLTKTAAEDVRDSLDTAAYVATRTALKALDTAKDTVAILTEPGREGIFVWNSGNYSARITADANEGVYVKANAIASTAGAWVRVYANLLDVHWFGAVGDGTTNDATAIQAALDLGEVIGAGVMLRDLNYVAGSTISVDYDGAKLLGAGPYQTVITGNFLSGDILYVGVSSGQRVTMDVGGFRIASSVVKTSGAGLHAERIGRCFFHDIIADGQDGNGNLYHGFWFDKVDKVSLYNFEARSQQDGVRLNGAISGPKADFSMGDGKIASCAVGFHVGGAFGGTYLEALSIISNTTNVLIDTAIVAEVNREIMFSPTVAIDGGATGVKISDTTGGPQSYIQFDGTWIASASGNNVEIDASVGHTILFTGVRNYLAGSDGYEVASTAAYVLISGGQVAYCTGYGVNFTASNANSRVEMPMMHNNGSGNFNGTVSYMLRNSAGEVGLNRAPESGYSLVFGGATKAYGTVWTADDQNAYALKAGRYSSGYGGAAIDTSSLATFLELQVQATAMLRMTLAGRRVTVPGNFGRGAPVTKTGDFTLADTENHIINNKSSTCVMTSTPASYSGRELFVVNEAAQALNSNASNVVPRVGGAAGTAILPATDGAWAFLVSDGTNWKIMASGT